MSNPFANIFFTEPHKYSKAVSDLNKDILEKLLQRFKNLETPIIPRKETPNCATLVISPSAGYGKSHLIGRLFEELNQDATRVYIRPCTDTDLFWYLFLKEIVDELSMFNDKFEIIKKIDDQYTQLEAFAHGILKHLLISGIESEIIHVKDKHKEINALNKLSVKNFGSQKKAVEWVKKNLVKLNTIFDEQRKIKEIKLNASQSTWLNVLFNYAYFSNDAVIKETCVDWIKGECIEDEAAKNIGIAPKDIRDSNLHTKGIDQICKKRIEDLCNLAAFFRPFVFCFDQVEDYGDSSELASILGIVVSTLVNDFYNHMTVITANQDIWEKNIVPNILEARRDRICEYEMLSGLTNKQAIELINIRLEDVTDAKKKTLFIGDYSWVNELFKKTPKRGVRYFIKECSKRWEGSDEPTLALIYNEYIEKIKKQPERFVYDYNTFYWLVSKVTYGMSDIQVEEYKARFPWRWIFNGQEIYFSFEQSVTYRTWQAIIREAENHFNVKKNCKFVIFKTKDRPKIPGAGAVMKPMIENAEKEFLHIVELKINGTPVGIEKLYAARDLYLAMKEGNIPFSHNEVIDFVRAELKPLWDEIKRPIVPPVTDNNKTDKGEEKQIDDKVKKVLEAKIKEIVKKNRFIEINRLVKELNDPSLSVQQCFSICKSIKGIKIENEVNDNGVVRWQKTR
ncbi:MAG: hypothetical protein HQL06_11535 [Nitrospirae bacterium]|nr:hypothetical protein [Nitrospirota bacterium]